MEYVSTGIRELDYLLGGGYPRNSVTTVSGPVGSGKSSFALQYLVEGAVSNDEVVLCVALEEGKRALLSRGVVKGVSLQTLESDKRLLFREYPLDEVNDMLSSHDDPIKNMVRTMDIERVVIEPVEVFTMLYSDPLERRRALLRLINKIREWNVTSLVVAEDADYPWYEVPRTKSGVESITDGFIHLSYQLTESNVRKRFMEIVKMRGVHVPNKLFEFEFDDKKGVVIKNVRVPRTFVKKQAKQKPRKKRSHEVSSEEIGDIEPDDSGVNFSFSFP